MLHALSQVTDQALTGASASNQALGHAFTVSADSVDTLSYSGFSPVQTLSETASLAARQSQFGQAWDTLRRQASHESVFDDTHALVAGNSVLQTAAVQGLLSLVAPDGTLTTTVGQLESLVNSGVRQMNDQNCTLPAGSSGGSASDCTAGALHDAQRVAQQCSADNDASPGCQAARNLAQDDSTRQLSTLASQHAATAAAADALGYADQRLQQAEAAQAQAAAQIDDEENQYLNYQSSKTAEKTGFDVAELAVTLSVAEIDPVAAFGGLLNVVGDAVGFGFSGPDPNTIILDGLKNVSQQITSFANYTQDAFHALDTQLSGLSRRVGQDAAQLNIQLTQVEHQLTQLSTSVTQLQSSVDHLQSEVQLLFASGAANELSTLITTYLGYNQANTSQLSEHDFATAAGALFTDAASTALSPIVANIPRKFDALSASSLLLGSDPRSLDANLNYFNVFGAQVTDSAGAWPGPLTTTCAVNPTGATTPGLCLPDPDFWATSARAFAQLLAENPGLVTPTRIQQLGTLQREGQFDR